MSVPVSEDNQKLVMKLLTATAIIAAESIVLAVLIVLILIGVL